MSLQDPTDRQLRLARIGSGLIWSVVFYLSGLLLVSLLSWLFATLTADLFLLSALPVFLAALFLNYVLPRPQPARRWSSIGLHFDRRAVTLFLLGAGLSAGAALTVTGAQLASGMAELSTDASPTVSWRAGSAVGTVLLSTLLFSLAAAGEELAFRGYGLQQLGRALTPPGAVVATSLFFGGVHGWNPDANELAVANTMLFGLVFGLALVWSRSLWLPFGLHLGWNLMLSLLGAKISGITMRSTTWAVEAATQSAWSGGDYGAEGSLLAIVACVALLAAVRWLARPSQSGPLIWEELGEEQEVELNDVESNPPH